MCLCVYACVYIHCMHVHTCMNVCMHVCMPISNNQIEDKGKFKERVKIINRDARILLKQNQFLRTVKFNTM